MLFWRKKKNIKEQEQEAEQDRIVHRKSDPEIEPPVEYDADLNEDQKQELQETESEIIQEMPQTPTPEHTAVEDETEAEELEDHSDEGGWLSRLSQGLSKSSNKLGTVPGQHKQF